MEFKASLDLTGKLMTVGVCVLLGAIAARHLYRIVATRPSQAEVLVTLAEVAFLLAIPLFSYLFSPQKYVLRDRALVIQRAVRSVVLPFEQIESVEVLSPEDVSGAFRYFGVGGLFGYYGRFWRPELGRVTFYLKNKTNPIAITTKRGEKLIVSPDSPEMARALRSAWLT